MRAGGRYKDLNSRVRSGRGVRVETAKTPGSYPLQTQKPSSSVGGRAGVPDSLRAQAGCFSRRPEGGLGTARMKTRLLTILLAAGSLVAASLTALTIPAVAQTQTVTVQLPSGEIVQVTVDVPPGQSLADIQLPGKLVHG